MPSLQEVLRVYLRVDRSPVTNRNYAALLTRLVTAVGPARDIRRVTNGDLVDWMADLRESVASTSYRQYNQVVKSFFAWCVENKYLKESPAAGLTARVPPKKPIDRAIPDTDLNTLLDALRYRPRDFAMIMFLADTGCRVGGLVSLRLSTLNLEDMTALVHEKGDRYYTVYFTQPTAEALRNWLARRPADAGDRVFPIRAGSVAAMMARLTEKVCSRVYRPHSIRHAVGHRWAQEGVPVSITQHKLGHTNPDTTMTFYYPNSEEHLRELTRRHSLVSSQSATPTPSPDPKPIQKEGKIIWFVFGS